MVFIILSSLLIGNVVNREPLITKESYIPQINPNDFVSKIDNKYLTFTPGKKFIYEGKTEEGIERTEVYITYETRKVIGVNAVVVWDRVWLNNELIEDTKDWYAQDKDGNVWYFGEDSKELVNGKVVSTEGSWEAGVDEAQPGIVMKANPKVGDTYRQEYYKGEAEDLGEVIALGVKIRIKYGTFTECLQTKDRNPLEPGDDEYKYYCPAVGGLVYEVGVENGEGAQLTDIQTDSKATEIKEEPEALKKEITKQEAIEIAQKAVEGKVTDVEIEKKYSRAVYVVEIDVDGVETDVIIDIETGEVLGIET